VQLAIVQSDGRECEWTDSERRCPPMFASNGSDLWVFYIGAPFGVSAAITSLGRIKAGVAKRVNLKSTAAGQLQRVLSLRRWRSWCFLRRINADGSRRNFSPTSGRVYDPERTVFRGRWALMSAHERGDFPPQWDHPPPRACPIIKRTSKILRPRQKPPAPTTAPWGARDGFIEKLKRLSGKTAIGSSFYPDDDELATLIGLLEPYS